MKDLQKEEGLLAVVNEGPHSVDIKSIELFNVHCSYTIRSYLFELVLDTTPLHQNGREKYFIKSLS
jgi:hypothetical protein